MPAQKKINKKEFIQMWNKGISAIDIAKHFGCTRGYIYTYITRNNLITKCNTN